MMDQNVHLVIMAGGQGQRLWPWSTKAMPKQFQDFFGEGSSLLQMTVNRFKDLMDLNNIWVVTQSEYKKLVQEQLPWIAEQQILCEPTVKNTAICIAYACQIIANEDATASLVITPADHYIAHKSIFKDSIQQALQHAQQSNRLTLLGVPCVKPETGYGYIAYELQESNTKRVIDFKEKPSIEQALVYMRQGKYAWNTGIFVGKLATFIEHYQIYLPIVWEKFTANQAYLASQQMLADLYEQLPAISFDQGILEKSTNLSVVCQDLGWSDLGTWDSLYKKLPKDDRGNVIQGQVMAINTDGCFIKGESDKLIAICGVKDLVVVQHQDKILIGPKSMPEMLKALIKQLEKEVS